MNNTIKQRVTLQRFFCNHILICAIFLLSFIILISSVIPVQASSFVTARTHAQDVESDMQDLVVKRPDDKPVMRVLLGDALQPTKFTSEHAFVVENLNKKIIFHLQPNDIVRIKYRKGYYYAIANGVKIRAKHPLKVRPLMRKHIIEVINFENRPAWNTDLNDNIFYDSVEVVYSENSGKALLVNEIGLEKYISGIAEVSNNNETAYLKALLTAARTYAFYHINHPTKHADEPYILNATEGDQVYRGAGFTQRAPNVVKAQKKTRRKIITYQGEGIIAPYFSRSDGRTRAWSEVWGGSYDWAQSVEDPGCEGEELLGHGVGLSGTGARYFAGQGWGWKKILKYYYTDVKLKKLY